MLVDSHAHIVGEFYKEDWEDVIERSLKDGVWVINIGTNKKTSIQAVNAANLYPEGVYATAALHPEYLSPDSKEYEEFEPDFFKKLAEDKKIAAIGETGLDYHILVKAKSEGEGIKTEERKIESECEGKKIRARQREVFKRHIELAIEVGKPLSIHVRDSSRMRTYADNDAHSDVLEILSFYHLNHNSKLRGVIHSFSGGKIEAARYRALGFKVAFNGIITFTRDYDEAVIDTPLEDILIETDAPFLTPVPFRGKRNEPIYVKYVAEKIAEIKGLSFERVAEQTTANARELFGI